MVIEKAGCILVNDEMKKVGLIYRKKHNDYSFPKGHMEKGETLIECALRETVEETSRECEIVSKKHLLIEKYVTPSNENVRVYFYLALDKGPSDDKCGDRHDLIWVDFDEVEEVLSYPNLKQMWNQVKDQVYELMKK